VLREEGRGGQTHKENTVPEEREKGGGQGNIPENGRIGPSTGPEVSAEKRKSRNAPIMRSWNAQVGEGKDDLGDNGQGKERHFPTKKKRKGENS